MSLRDPVSTHRPARHVAILVETDDTWGRSVVEAIARHARIAGWTLLICPRDAERRLRLPRRWGGDGVIVSIRDPKMARHVRECGSPAVDVSITLPAERWLSRVATDDRLRAELAFGHLRERGFENFATYAPTLGRYPDRRCEQFVRVAAEAGFECSNFATIAGRYGDTWPTDWNRLAAWLDSLPKPVAVFAADAYPARHLAELCERQGIRLPDEVAVLAGDTDELICNVAWPQLSSVELASHRIGHLACQELAVRMDDDSAPPTLRLVAPLRVVERHSTDVMAIADPEMAEILAMVRRQATAGLEVRDLLGQFPISRRGLELKFKRLLGRTPAEEIRRVRLERAKQLLLETDRSVESVAHAVGMSSGPALFHAFRKYIGMTPGEFRTARPT